MTDLIRYDLLVQDAMRGVMRQVLSDVAENGGLPGEHHFTISFRTGAPGVKISRRLAEQWPRELTIILQHQYSDLLVDETGFGVKLSFRSIPESLYIPFEAVTGFFDPSVEFGLRWEIGADEGENDEDEDGDEEPPRFAPHLVRPGDEAPTRVEPAKAESAKTEPAKPAPAPAGAVDKAEAGDDGAKIVSIDAFRKKP